TSTSRTGTATPGAGVDGRPPRRRADVALRTQTAPTPRPPEPDVLRPRGAPRHLQIAQVLAFFAVVAALIGALGPAEPIRTSYTWPPADLPKGDPASLWYTPL